MGFWPYFLQDQQSDGGPSFLCCFLTFSSIFTATTTLSLIFLQNFIPLKNLLTLKFRNIYIEIEFLLTFSCLHVSLLLKETPSFDQLLAWSLSFSLCDRFFLWFCSLQERWKVDHRNRYFGIWDIEKEKQKQ